MNELPLDFDSPLFLPSYTHIHTHFETVRVAWVLSFALTWVGLFTQGKRDESMRER